MELSQIQVVDLAKTSKGYESFLRSTRMLRAWTAACFATVAIVLLSIVPIFALSNSTKESPLGVIVLFLIISLIGSLFVLFGYTVFYFYRSMALGSVRTMKWIVAGTGLFISILLLLALAIGYSNLKIIEAMGGIKFFDMNAVVVDVSKDLLLNVVRIVHQNSDTALAQSFVTTALVYMILYFMCTAIYLVGCAIFIAGPLNFLRYRKSPFGKLFIDKSFDPQFFLGMKLLWTNFARLMGLYAPSGYGRKTTQKVRLAIVSAFCLEGAVYGAYIDLARKPFEAIGDLAGFPVFGSVLIIMGMPLMVVLMAYALFWLSRRLREWALTKMILSLKQVRLEDKRRPVLFLRSFKDDQGSLESAKAPWLIRLVDPGSISTNIEHLLIKNLDHVGPVVAIGNPGDKLPPLGAARDYVKENFVGESWHDVVSALIRECTLIVMALGDSEGLHWEIETIRKCKMLHKLVILIPPVFSRNIDLRDSVLATLGYLKAHTAHLDERDQESQTPYMLALIPTVDHPLLITSNRTTEIDYELSLRYFLSSTTHAHDLEADRGNNDEGVSHSPPVLAEA
jgi:hypothetical protein